MAKPLSADDILPLVACLTPQERLRLRQLIRVQPELTDGDVDRSLLPAHDEFASDEDPLAWDAEGWEGIG